MYITHERILCTPYVIRYMRYTCTLYACIQLRIAKHQLSDDHAQQPLLRYIRKTTFHY